MEKGSEIGVLLAPGAGRLPRLSRRFFALCLDMMAEGLLDSKEEEELSEMFKAGGSLEYEEEEALEAAANQDDLLILTEHFE